MGDLSTTIQQTVNGDNCGWPSTIGPYTAATPTAVTFSPLATSTLTSINDVEGNVYLAKPGKKYKVTATYDPNQEGAADESCGGGGPSDGTSLTITSGGSGDGEPDPS